MIFGKDAEELQKKLEQVDQRLNELASLVKESDARSEQRFHALEEHSDQLSEQLVRELENVTDELRAVEQARLDVEKSTRSFAEVQKKVEQFTFEKLGDVIREQVEHLKLESNRYDAVKKDIERATLLLVKFGDDIAKFKAIADEIKKSDFDLSKYARELTRTDEEKVKLMKEVDELQRLVAKMRREERQERPQPQRF